MKVVRLYLCFAIILLEVNCAAAGFQAMAQDSIRDLTQIPIEDLSKLEVYSASKFPQKASDAPSSISIITAEDIRRYGYRTFADILRSVTGFYISYDRNYSYIGSRGFGRLGDYNSRVLILANGHRLNENIYGGNYINMEFPIDVDLIKQVEVVRGPGSSLYGTGAFFAVVNVITKRGGDYEGVALSSEGGSQGTHQERVRFGIRSKNGLDVLFAGSYLDSKGFRQLYFPEFGIPATNGGIAQDADTERVSNAFAAISYRDLKFQFAYDNRRKAIPTASFGTYFNDRNTHTIDRRSYFDLEFRRTFSNTWDITGRAYYDIYNYDGFYDFDYSDSDMPLLNSNIDSADGVWWGAEAQVSRKIGARHHLTTGFEMMRSIRADQMNYDNPPFPYLLLDDRRHPSNTGVFLQDEFTISSNLILNAGLRYDHYSTFGDTINPRLGLIFAPKEKTTIKLLYGHAFRAPSVFELYYRDENVWPDFKVDLKPETIKTTELVLERFVGRRFRMAGSLYYYRLSRLISSIIKEEDNSIAFDNSGKIHARGMEIEFEGKNIHGFDGRLSYALQKATNQAEPKVLSNSPRHIVQFNLTLPIAANRGWAGIEMRYIGPRATVYGGHAGGFFLTNVTFLQKNLFGTLEFSASLYNVFDKRYADPGSREHRQDTILQDGRTFRIRLSYAFPLFKAKSGN
jgi:outer membrane receptor for ferrienterochelin and colicins